MKLFFVILALAVVADAANVGIQTHTKLTDQRKIKTGMEKKETPKLRGGLKAAIAKKESASTHLRKSSKTETRVKEITTKTKLRAHDEKKATKPRKLNPADAKKEGGKPRKLKSDTNNETRKRRTRKLKTHHAMAEATKERKPHAKKEATKRRKLKVKTV